MTFRFIAVTQPISYAKHKSSERVYIMLALTWVISICISSPIAFGMNYTKRREQTPNLCTFYNSDFLIYSSMGSFYIPGIAMMLLYWRIFRAIRLRARKASSSQRHRQGNSSSITQMGRQTDIYPPTCAGDLQQSVLPSDVILTNGGNRNERLNNFDNNSRTVVADCGIRQVADVSDIEIKNKKSAEQRCHETEGKECDAERWRRKTHRNEPTGGDSSEPPWKSDVPPRRWSSDEDGVFLKDGGDNFTLERNLRKSRTTLSPEEVIAEETFLDEKEDAITRGRHCRLFVLSDRLSSSTVATTVTGIGERSTEHLSTATSASGFLSSITTLTTDGITSPTSLGVLPSSLSGTRSSFPHSASDATRELLVLQDGACFTNVTHPRRPPESSVKMVHSRSESTNIQTPPSSSDMPKRRLNRSNDNPRRGGANVSESFGVDHDIISNCKQTKRRGKTTGSSVRLDSSNQSRGDFDETAAASPWRNFRARRFQFGLSSVRAVKSSLKATTSSRSQKEKSATRRERKATKTLAIVLGVFLLCWVPFFTINIVNAVCIRYDLFEYRSVCQIDPILFSFFVWLGYMNSFLNPVIYTIFNIEFRRAFKKILQKKCK